METASAIAALAALAQENRLDVYRLLVEAGSSGMAVGRIAERLGLPPATLSFHLSQLKHAGLVSFRRDGRSLIYSANFAAMNELLGYLTKNCCAAEGADCDITAEACGAGGSRPAASG
jgi:ArsR family transcriptional regulator, arsenate/arsenite/antimonite-responsive transcriptional repressor